MKKTIIAIAILLIIGVAGSIYFATSSATYVAKVDGEKITQSELDEALNKQYGSATLDTLIQDKVVKLEAAKQKVTVSAKDVDAQVSALATQYGGEEGLESALASSNMTLDDLKGNLETYVLASKMIEKTLDTSDATLKAYLKENEATFATTAQVKASHILVEKKATATKIKKELDEGADFATLAKKYSTDTGSKENGGDLGYFAAADMVEEFSNKAFSMKKGEISEPVKSDYGYHIIKVTGIKEAKDANYDEIKDEVKDAYVQAQVSGQYSTWLTSVMADYKVKNNLTDEVATETTTEQ